LKLGQKIKKVLNPLSYRRGWRRTRRLLWPLPLKPLLANLDQDRLREIQARYATSTNHYVKYAEVDRFWRENRKRIQDLGLHRCTSKRVLDVGCGGGFFLYLLQQLGHEVLGLDIEEFPLFGELVDLFGVPRLVWAIEAFKPLPDLGARFDYITAFATRFNRSVERDWYWGPSEWNFFLDDLEQYLAPGGQIFFSLNRRHREGDYHTPELREFFLSRGASVERDRVFFPNGLRPWTSSSTMPRPASRK